ncbi:MAG: hypothetical protein GC157_02585 [Frankiales bacterium]|nr:hypothetical protein [Frankiales bacterium]
MDLEDLRLAVYRAFAHEGRAPGVDDLAERFGVPAADVRSGLAALAAARHLALAADGTIAMAHPFSSVPLGFSVMGAATLWWGGCAWDSFALAHLLPWEPSVLVATTCPACSAAHAWTVTREAPPAGGQVAHFLVPAARMWDDVVTTCGNQRIFCDEACVQDWLTRERRERGYVMDLPTLWRLAADWYTGRLERGYVRREPSEAADYLRGVGLSGSFWGL